jgi:hypothetical protein
MVVAADKQFRESGLAAALRHDDGLELHPPPASSSPTPTRACLTTHQNMAASTAHYKDRQFLAVIGDEVRSSSYPQYLC